MIKSKKKLLTVLMLISFALLSSSCLRWRRNPERFYFGNYSEAEALFNKGKYAEALAKYDAYVTENPEGNLAVIADYYRAKCHVTLGHKGEARALFSEIIKKHSETVWAKFAQSQLDDLPA